MSIVTPQIDITFKQLASTAIERSARGVVCVVFNDAVSEIEVKELHELNDLDSATYSSVNYQAVVDAFLGSPSKVYTVAIPTSDSFADAKATLDTLKFNYLCYLSATNQASVATYVKDFNKNSKTRRIKGVVFANAADDDHVINFTNTKVTRLTGGEVNGNEYLARVAGLLAGMPFSRTSTYYLLKDLKSVVEPSDVDAAVSDGEFVIINDYGEVKVARGVNSLQTLPEKVKSEEFKKIAIIDGADTVLEDIASAFQSDYIGKFKNSLDNQMLLVANINEYLLQLAKEEVLDVDFDNHVEIDIEAQRAAWVAYGKTEAQTWDDELVMKSPFGSQVFLKGNLKFLDGMEDVTIVFSV